MPKAVVFSAESRPFPVDASGKELTTDKIGRPLFDTGEVCPRKDPEVSYARRAVHVGWVRGGLVDLGVVAFPVENEHSVPENPDEFKMQGTFITLDRKGINDAIRALRRARDAAYGPDA